MFPESRGHAPPSRWSGAAWAEGHSSESSAAEVAGRARPHYLCAKVCPYALVWAKAWPPASAWACGLSCGEQAEQVLAQQEPGLPVSLRERGCCG